MPKKYWIKKAVKRKGSLSRALGIPIEDNIPMELLNAIVRAKAGQTIRNPTTKGKRIIKVTRRLEHQAVLARNLKRMN